MSAVSPRAQGRDLWQMVSGDRARQVITVAAAAAQVLLPSLYGPRFDSDERPPDVITPAPYTFAVWFPIFAASAGYAGLQARAGSADSELNRRVGWPLAAAFASTGIWAPLVRTGRYWPAQAALAGIAAFAEVARRRLAREVPTEPDAIMVAATATTGMLAAWGAAATGVNLASMLVGEGIVKTPVAQRVVGSGLLLGLGAGGAYATASTAAAPRVSRIYAGTLLWGLAGIVMGQRTRSRPTAVTAAAAAVPVLIAAVGGRRRSGR